MTVLSRIRSTLAVRSFSVFEAFVKLPAKPDDALIDRILEVLHARRPRSASDGEDDIVGELFGKRNEATTKLIP